MLLLIPCLTATRKQLFYWRDTETLFRHAIAVTKDNDVAHENLGFTLQLEGRSAAALAEYRKALAINPAYYQLHYSIGNMLQETGKPAEALTEYRILLHIKPNNAALHNAIGSALVLMGKNNEAIEEFSTAKQLDARYAMPYVGTAKISFGQGHDTEGTNDLRQAVQLDPYNVQILLTAARYLVANQNAAFRDARLGLMLAAKADELSAGEKPDVLDVLGMAYAANGNFTNAVDCAEDALTLASALHLDSTNKIQERLELYQHNQAWQVSFLATNQSTAH